MTKHDLALFSAVQSAEAIQNGRISSEALVEACLKRIEETDSVIRAWAYLDAGVALDQAREMDRIRKAGRATGPLHGVPVGLKDIVDTNDMPTQRGTTIFSGRRSETDARLVEHLREAGAVIMGKTKTTEFAFMHPTDTTNPFNSARTPGGSSSGSAAAVAARHVPLAIGTQTGGSVIRPASFCGVYGFKPTQGTISRTGVFRTSVSLDQVGGFANSLEDIALLTDVISGYDQSDPASFARPRAKMLEGAQAEVPVEPNIARLDFPFDDRLDADTVEGINAVIDGLGGQVERFSASPELSDLINVHKTIYDYEIRQNMAEISENHWPAISTEMQSAVNRGAEISATQYEDALLVMASAQSFFTEYFNDFDAILAPSAKGEAVPLNAGHTGDSVFCLAWTLAGLPCLTLPLLVGQNDLPIGVQLIGAVEEDDRLLRTASWVQRSLNAQEQQGE
ncbi:amidase [Ruegeria atlantica]|uniref:Glutamyl-tRNA(Gln) amidotransferase subunit A n=1 Tax=Ruegeria atlantica TaxID=81569 RepID=A0A0P1EWX0_9RHOB|nr:amidase [Ruegeria atlantica]CUH47035.1 Glutamyl-tRNA(Gln) amidotransferase subunit A [Ruegeria atlantica]